VRRAVLVAAGVLVLGLVVALLLRSGARPARATDAVLTEEEGERTSSTALERVDSASGEMALETAEAVEPDPAPPQPAGTRAALIETAPIHGVLLDKETGRAIERGVALALRARDGGRAHEPERVEPGAGGVFTTRSAFPRARLLVQVLEARSGELLFSVQETFDPAHSDWTLRVGLRLLVPLDIGAPPDVELTGLQGRLVVVGPDETDERGWDRVRGGAAPFLLYQQSGELEPGEEAWLELQATDESEERLFQGRVRLLDAQGALAPVEIELVEETRVAGLVVDAQGHALEDVAAWFLPRAAGAGELEWDDLGDESGEDGRFRVDGLASGAHDLVLARGQYRAPPRRVELRPGWNDLGTLVLDPPAGGIVRGEVVTDDGDDPRALLVLTDLASGARQYAVTDFQLFGASDGRSAFVFDPVPAGEYELHPIGILGERFEPARRHLSGPAEGLEFRAVGPRGGGWAFRVTDAASHAPVEEFGVLACTEGIWWGWDGAVDDPVPFAGERLLVCAEGYRAAPVAPDAPFEATTREEHGQRVEVRVVEVELERGWSRSVLCRSSESGMTGELAAFFAPPLAGVRVLSDGQPAATTDATGFALLSLSAAPRRIEVALPGWHTVSSQDEDELLHIVLLARD